MEVSQIFRAAVVVSASAMFAACGGGGDAVDDAGVVKDAVPVVGGGGGAPSEGTPPVKEPGSPGEQPGSGGEAQPPVTQPPVGGGEVQPPEESKYARIVDLPPGPIGNVDSVLMAADSRHSTFPPPSGTEVINNIKNPVTGQVVLRVAGEPGASSGNLGRIGIQASQLETLRSSATGFDERIVSLTTRTIRIVQFDYDVSSGNSLRFTLFGAKGGTGYAAIGAWEAVFTGLYVTDYSPVTGAFVFGLPTIATELTTIDRHGYAGVAVGKLRYSGDWIGSPSYPVAGAVVNATVDMATNKVAVRVAKMTSIRDQADWGKLNAQPSDALFACEADIDVQANRFSCELRSLDDYTLLSGGKISGRFYGPSGKEIGGVLSYWDWSNFPANQVVAGFVLEAQ